MHSQGFLRSGGWATGDGKLVGIEAYTRSPQIQSLEGRTKARRERIEVNAPLQGVLSWWVKIFSSVKRAQPVRRGLRFSFDSVPLSYCGRRMKAVSCQLFPSPSLCARPCA